MSGRLGRFVRHAVENGILKSSNLRRLAWRAGRSLYCLARGEQRIDDMRVDGELDLQRRVVAATSAETRFIAFDVGANQGEWTLALVDLFERREGGIDRLDAHVFEPVPATRERLVQNLSWVDTRSIRVNRSALSDRVGTTEMIVMSETGGTNSLVYDDAMTRQAVGFVPVPLTTIDVYCADANIDRIHIVKCDAEGHDLAVMRGAAGMLSLGRIDVFQFEYNHRWITSRTYLKDVFDLIEGMPYRLGRIMPNLVEVFDAWHPELERYFQSNFVLLGAGAHTWFSVTDGTFDEANVYSWVQHSGSSGKTR